MSPQPEAAATKRQRIDKILLGVHGTQADDITAESRWISVRSRRFSYQETFPSAMRPLYGLAVVCVPVYLDRMIT